MTPHVSLIQDPETGNDTETVAAYIYPASELSVGIVLSARVNADDMVDENDGRSAWVWIRLSNGDLALATFPQGETYFAVEEDSGIPSELTR